MEAVDYIKSISKSCHLCDFKTYVARGRPFALDTNISKYDSDATIFFLDIYYDKYKDILNKNTKIIYANDYFIIILADNLYALDDTRCIYKKYQPVNVYCYTYDKTIIIVVIFKDYLEIITHNKEGTLTNSVVIGNTGDIKIDYCGVHDTTVLAISDKKQIYSCSYK